MEKAYMQYFQKSKIFLYPLLDIRKGEEFVPVDTYICWDGLYRQDDYKYICVYKTIKNLKFKNFERKYLINHPLLHYKEDITPEGSDNNIRVYIFDLSEHKHDFDMFVLGSYSKFSIDVKNKILKYFGKTGRISQYIQSYLDPESHHKIYADALDVNLNTIKEVHELCTPPDLEKETLIREIPNEFALLINNSISLEKI
tara:strand:- start:3791 stop:4387 length:597 start_codon:yes stop_codon:yes gene_type:complete